MQCLQSWHPMWVSVQAPIASLPIQLLANSSRKAIEGDHQPGPAPGIADI